MPCKSIHTLSNYFLSTKQIVFILDVIKEVNKMSVFYLDGFAKILNFAIYFNLDSVGLHLVKVE